MSSWEKPRENTIESLVHGINFSDGVELDLRLSEDEQLVLYHNSITDDNRFPECELADELPDYIKTFDELLSKKEFTREFTERGKFVCIELKPPHPNSGKAGGWIRGLKRLEHMQKMVDLVNESLEGFDINPTSAVIYSFEKKILQTKQKNSNLKVSRLMPYLRQWGNEFTQRALAVPSYVMNSLPRLMNKNKKNGSPMLPCALEYLHGYTRFLNLGTTVGIHGSYLEKLNRIRGGFPVYVWPAKPELERKIWEAGLTGLSDDFSPELVTLPSGHARWSRPATQPLSEEELEKLDSTPTEHHAERLSEMKREVTPWYEFSDVERIAITKDWIKRWGWKRKEEEILGEVSENSLPWESVRIVGHRGSGKTHGW